MNSTIKPLSRLLVQCYLFFQIRILFSCPLYLTFLHFVIIIVKCPQDVKLQYHNYDQIPELCRKEIIP